MISDQVIQALEEQVGCYRRLARLAEVQHDHVQQERTEELIEVLARRQDVLNDVAKLEQTVSPARRRWEQYVGELDAERRRRAEALLTESRRLLEQITAADQEDALVLQQRKLNLGKQIGQATAARQVNRTYAAAAYGQKASRMDVRQ
jgi:hypothetical protein